MQQASEFTPDKPRSPCFAAIGIPREETRSPCSALQIVLTRNKSAEAILISGTYIHPMLVVHVACWISETFALKVSRIVNNFIIAEYKTKLEAAHLHLGETQKQLGDAHLQVEEKTAKVNELNEDLLNIDTQRIKVTEDAGARKKDRQLWASSHAFTFLHLNEERALNYYAIRCHRYKMVGAINKLRSKHPHAEVLFQHKQVPNAINLYGRLRGNKLIKSSRNYCSPTTTERELLEDIKAMCGMTTHQKMLHLAQSLLHQRFSQLPIKCLHTPLI